MSKTIYKLLEKLLEEVSGKVWALSSEGYAPKAVAEKVKSYRSNAWKSPDLWKKASFEMLGLIASLELLARSKGKHLFRVWDQVTLQMEYGVNAFSREATRQALLKMHKDLQELKAILNYCKAVEEAGRFLVGRQMAMGVKNASHIHIEGHGLNKLNKLNTRLQRALNKRIRLLEMIIHTNEAVLRAHRGSEATVKSRFNLRPH